MLQRAQIFLSICAGILIFSSSDAKTIYVACSNKALDSDEALIAVSVEGESMEIGKLRIESFVIGKPFVDLPSSTGTFHLSRGAETFDYFYKVPDKNTTYHLSLPGDYSISMIFSARLMAYKTTGPTDYIDPSDKFFYTELTCRNPHSKDKE